ncbi:hypothetical protein NHJ13734_007781 [Beauveria thailandica]
MNSTSTPSNYDASLGPTASHCGAESRFVFTVAFQHSVLSITPYVIFFECRHTATFYLWKHSFCTESLGVFTAVASEMATLTLI